MPTRMITLILALAAAQAVRAGDIRILQVGPTSGVLTWTNAPVGATCRIEEAHALPDPAGTNWHEIVSVVISNSLTSVVLPVRGSTGADPQTTHLRVVWEFAAPELVAPADGATYDTYPRTTVYEWKTVPGATAYAIEIQYGTSSLTNWSAWVYADELTTTSYTNDFIGAQPGRWRVWATDDVGHASEKSPWRITYYEH